LHRRRRDEVEPFSRWYSRQGYRILELDLEGEEFLEGGGDLLWNPDWESIWAGFGHRSTRAAVDQFAALMEGMGFGVRKLELVDPHFFHLLVLPEISKVVHRCLLENRGPEYS